jgi:hypothetical protein
MQCAGNGLSQADADILQKEIDGNLKPDAGRVIVVRR